MAKSIYHSELESLTNEHGGAWIRLEKEPSDRSKNKDLAGFATITDWDGVAGRYINIENENVLNALRAAPVGAAVWIKAGGKGPEAWVELLDEQGNLLASSKGQTAPPPSAPPQSGPPAGPPAGPPQGAPPSAPPAPSNGAPQGAPPAPPTNHANEVSMAQVMFRAMEAATGVMDTYTQSHPKLMEDVSADAYYERIAAMANSMFIEWQRSGGTKSFVRQDAQDAQD